MKTRRFAPQSAQAGGALVYTLVSSAVLGVSMASYLGLVSTQNQSVMRSMAWNHAVGVLEGGVEEALMHLNQNHASSLASQGWTTQSSLDLGVTNLTGTFYVKERSHDEVRYRVAISSGSAPTIYSQGWVRVPSSTNEVFRVVRVTTLSDGMWMKAMVAKEQIDMNGQNVMTDSFDSSNPLYSTGGQYDPLKARNNGDVATNGGIEGILTVGNADIYGRSSTGPGGTVSLGPGGGIGSRAWRTSNNGVQPGWPDDDMNVQFRDVTAPYASGLTMAPATVGGTNYTYYLNGGDYYRSELSLNGTKVMLVTNHCRLYIPGDVALTGNALIRIAPNSSLKVYVGGSASFGGNGIINQSGCATNLYYYGLPSNTSLSISGNGAFIGAIYAPSAAFVMNGGGSSSTNDFIGASVSKTVRMNGHFNFHYDELLGRVGPSTGFDVTSWNEL